MRVYARVRSYPHCHQPVAALNLIVNFNEKMDSERLVETVRFSLHGCLVIIHSEYKEAVSTGMVLKYLAVIVSVPASSASYLNLCKKNCTVYRHSVRVTLSLEI